MDEAGLIAERAEDWPEDLNAVHISIGGQPAGSAAAFQLGMRMSPAEFSSEALTVKHPFNSSLWGYAMPL